MKMKNLLLLTWITLQLQSSLALTEHIYNEIFTNKNLITSPRTHKMYNRYEGPNSHGASTISINIDFESNGENKTSIFVIGTRKEFASDANVVNFPEMCSKERFVVSSLQTIPIDFDENNKAQIKKVILANKTGDWLFKIITCNKEIYADGYVSFKNAFGYLDGNMYYYISWCMWFIIILLLMFIWYANQMFRFKEFHSQHIIVLTGIFISMCSAALILSYNEYINYVGEENYPFFITQILIKIFAEATFLILIGLISTGYKITKTKISFTKKSFIFLTNLIYILTRLIQEEYRFDINYNTINGVITIFTVCNIITSIIFYFYCCWALVAISNTVEESKMHKRRYTLLFKMFATLIFLFVFLNAFNEVFKIGFKIIESFFPSFWKWERIPFLGLDFLFQFVVLCAAMKIWKPQKTHVDHIIMSKNNPESLKSTILSFDKYNETSTKFPTNYQLDDDGLEEHSSLKIKDFESDEDEIQKLVV